VFRLFSVDELVVEFEALYPNDPLPEDLTLCAPRPESGPRLQAALRLIPETRRADERRATRGA